MEYTSTRWCAALGKEKRNLIVLKIVENELFELEISCNNFTAGVSNMSTRDMVIDICRKSHNFMNKLLAHSIPMLSFQQMIQSRYILCDVKLRLNWWGLFTV